MAGLDRPYRRIARPFVGGDYMRQSQYITHAAFAISPERYVRSFTLILADLRRLFEYIDPSDANSGCYSFRTHELLMRASIEVEANCKAILSENHYAPLTKPKSASATPKPRDQKSWNMKDDYSKIEASHLVSEFRVRVPQWAGNQNIRAPFGAWTGATPVSLPWYQAYNATKHDRHINFSQATLGNVVDAVCGVLVMLVAQFATYDFDPTSNPIGRGDEGTSFWPAHGYFTVRFPDSWPEAERYGFADNWGSLRTETDPFRSYPYPP